VRRQTAGFQTNAVEFRLGSNADRSPVRAFSILFRWRGRTPSQARLAQCDDRAIPAETATAPDTRTTQRGCPGKRHRSRQAVFAIPPGASAAGAVGASFPAKDSV